MSQYMYIGSVESISLSHHNYFVYPVGSPVFPVLISE